MIGNDCGFQTFARYVAPPLIAERFQLQIYKTTFKFFAYSGEAFRDRVKRLGSGFGKSSICTAG